MEPTEILIKVKLSPKVLEGLEDGEVYQILIAGVTKGVCMGAEIKLGYKVFSHIYLPLTVTTEMVEKEAERKYGALYGTDYADKTEGFQDAINWLLSLNKE